MHNRVGQGLIVLFVLFGMTSFGLVPASAARMAAGPSDPAELEAFVDGVMADQMESKHIPGAVVAVVKDGALFFAKGYGYADLEQRTPVDAERTLFRPGSASKLFTWTAVMQLVERGQLDLDHDVNTYLDFAIPATYAQPITLKHLMTHTSGFEDVGLGLWKIDGAQVVSLEEYLKTSLPARVFPPGELGAYSNYGTALAGYIVERVSGMPFAEYADENIFTPLGMRRSTFRQPVPSELASDVSKGYNFTGGAFVEGGFEFVVPYPAGSMSATATDMAKFMIAHLQDGRSGDARILEESTAQEMHRQAFTHDPRLDGMAYGFFESTVNGQRIVSHGGDTFQFHTGLFLIPEQQVGVFVSTNATGGARTGAALIEMFMDRYYPVEYQPAPQSPADFVERVAPYLGEYYPARSSFTTFEKVLNMFQPARLSLDREGNLLVSWMGETLQGVEIEPGLIRDRMDEGQRWVLSTDEAGKAYLLPSAPFPYIQTPWYGTGSFHLLLVLGSILLFLGTLIGWSVAFFTGLRKREPRPLPARLARWIAALFGLVLVVFLLGLLGMFGDTNPAFGVPNIFFETQASMRVLMMFPGVMALLGLAMLVFTALSWIRSYFGVGGRIHYALLTLSAMSMLWAMTYWNLLL